MICGSKAKHGGYCRRSSMPGKRRCKFHGSSPGGLRWNGLQAANAVYVAELRRLGLKHPGWPKGIPRSHVKRVAMAKAIIVQRREELSQRQSTGMAGRLEQVVLKGFDRIGEYLDMDAADENSEIRRHQSELASSLIRTQARLDDSIMQAQKDDRFLTVLEELARVEALPVPGKKG